MINSILVILSTNKKKPRYLVKIYFLKYYTKIQIINLKMTIFCNFIYRQIE